MLIRRIVLKSDQLTDLKGHFLASMNHELRTPLSGILGMTDLLLETPLTEEQKDYVGATRACAENLLEILNVTLEFSALLANHIQLEEAEFSLREMLEGLAAEFAPKAAAKNLRLIRSLDRRLPEEVVADAVRLRQLLAHLVSNAVKFTNEGEIELISSAGAVSDGRVPVTIRVRDTGIGIPPDQLNSIFEGFRQLETGLGRNYPGLGLGLAVAQKLATLLDGSISVESELGRGSTFTVQVYLRLPAETVLETEEPKKMRARVLVVDDNAVAQTIASQALRRQAFDVECAGDGLAAVQAASRSHFDVILMDLQMPGLDGFGATERIRTLQGYRETPIIALTANCSNDYRARCAAHGMQGFLAKPVRTRDLVQTVEKYVETVE